MPIYEYRCLKCSKDFEAMQKFSDAQISQCPNCGGKVKKKMSSTSFQLKGSGWYMTDYAKKGSKDSKSPSSETKESTPAPAPAASESKPASTDSTE
jgi:putative FmdB family regulatory protein